MLFSPYSTHSIRQVPLHKEVWLDYYKTIFVGPLRPVYFISPLLYGYRVEHQSLIMFHVFVIVFVSDEEQSEHNSIVLYTKVQHDHVHRIFIIAFIWGSLIAFFFS